jgi:hypothetical protein
MMTSQVSAASDDLASLSISECADGRLCTHVAPLRRDTIDQIVADARQADTGPDGPGDRAVLIYPEGGEPAVVEVRVGRDVLAGLLDHAMSERVC